jgi:glutaredoxin-related protein
VFTEYKRGTEEYQKINFKTQNEIITKTFSLADLCSTSKNKILSEMEQCEIKGSQWKLNRILKMELRINKYNPLRGSSYIPLPKVLANKKQ